MKNGFPPKYYRLKVLVLSHPAALNWVRKAKVYHPKNLTTLDATGHGDEHLLTFFIALTEYQRFSLEESLKIDR